MPSTVVYFDALPASIALIAACLILSGVSKSGSPAPRPMMSRPAALSARALSVTAMVGEGLMRLSASARKAIENLRSPRFRGASVVLGQTLSGKTQKVMHPSTAVMNPHGGKSDVAIPLRNDAAWR